MAVLAIQNSGAEGLGYLGELLRNDGFDVVSVNAQRQEIPGENFDLVVILGAPESANDDLPYLVAEQELVRDCIGNGVPVLGICLGSQLIARALGARVYAGHTKEIGFYDDMVPGDDALFSGFASPFTVFHWHGDTFDLPDGATRLASSAHYENQAFRYKSAVGLQFHLEVDEQTINLWLKSEELRRTPHIDPEQIRSDIAGRLPGVQSGMRAFYRNFKSAFGL